MIINMIELTIFPFGKNLSKTSFHLGKTKIAFNLAKQKSS